MLFTGQDCIYSTLKSPEVQSIASLLKISSMQCNVWCAELFFQKAKNDLGLFNWGGNMIFIGLYTKWILVLCSLHSSWLASNEKLCVVSDLEEDQVTVANKKIWRRGITFKVERSARTAWNKKTKRIINVIILISKVKPMKYGATETPSHCDAGIDAPSKFFRCVLTSVIKLQWSFSSLCILMLEHVQNASMDFSLEPSSNIQGSMSL